MMTTAPAHADRSRDEHYIASLARLMDDRILKHNDTFAVFDQHGNVNLVNDEQGVFHRDTRYLSHLSLRINDKTPVLLGSIVRDDNALLEIDITNPEIKCQRGDDEYTLRTGTLNIHRTMFLAHACCYDRLTIKNHGLDALCVTLCFDFAADFRDIFEVRGEHREMRGTMLDPTIDHRSVEFGYRGCDDILRTASLSWFPPPDSVANDCATFQLDIQPKEELSLDFAISLNDERDTLEQASHDDAREKVLQSCPAAQQRMCRITTSNDAFNGWVNRSQCDISLMLSDVGDEMRYPYAGVPWYNCVFGRDGLIVALQTLWCDASIARGVLRVLASTQSTKTDPQRDAEPGKIVHEMRHCEMAMTGEVPFRKYYGTVDATPLFIMLAGQYYLTTGDLQTIRNIWPNIESALTWIDEYGDRNGDGFIDYECMSKHGLANQGWKDSLDSVMHVDGELAKGPIALAEVQGYVYSARCLASQLASELGHNARADQLRSDAEQLKNRFDECFWCEQIQQYAIAIDGGTHVCAVRSSNPGHCLFTGIVPEHRAKAVADSLMARDMFTGWGVRTLSTTAPRYNPASYHNGSIWPHDNSIVAAGLSRYGFTGHALEILMGQFHASTWQDRFRLPELFCGFQREDKIGPVGYPVACSPQAWASGAVFLMISGTLGLSINALAGEVRLVRPSLPEAIREMRIENLSLGEATICLTLRRHGDTVDVAVTDRSGDVRVVLSR